MRQVIFAIATGMVAVAAPATAQTDWSRQIAETGLVRTEAAIAALPAPTPEDLFALGGVRFLAAIERALFLRWQVGATSEMAPVPILRLDLPLNRAPEPMRASLVTDIFEAIDSGMTGAEASLASIPADAVVGLTIRLEDLWFDIDQDGVRGLGEDLLPHALDSFTLPFDEPGGPASTTIRFDTADVAWLRAYTQLLSGIGAFVLAFDPTEATQRMLTSDQDKATRLASPNPTPLDEFDVSGWVDKISVAVLALRQQPDPVRTRAVAAHLRQMVVLNREFWQKVALETDNEAEWIPNPRQTSALGFVLPPDTDVAWLGILSELDQMLDGSLLVPHLALPPEAGINIATWLENPNPLDLVGWLQGMDAMAYAERGPTISGATWSGFMAMAEGRGVLFAILLN